MESSEFSGALVQSDHSDPGTSSSSGSSSSASRDSDYSHSSSGSSRQKYNFRRTSISNRLETEKKCKTPKVPKPKSRPPPLSKYRRKTANTRERERMQEVNEAFDDLRKVIPQYPAEKGKITKITTLTLAVNYIKALREVLGHKSDPDPSPESLNSSTSSSVEGDQPLSPPGSQGFQRHYSLSSPSLGSGSGLDSEGEAFLPS